jgi:myo-inositol 2-dehydrogenase/D-chiro-inositol 1-dehydrogenase/scyllo-inositol 2-dehydrogenase (NAD+)
LIGAGRAGMVHARNLRERLKGAELVALCDANEQALGQAARELGVELLFTDYQQACASPQIDAVIIVTPTFMHCAIACAAAAQGKHVFLEKPMAITVDECQRIIEATAAAGVRLQIGFMRRFDESFLRAKALIESGELGRVMIIKSTGRGPGLPPPWIYDVAKSNGILAEVNSHDFDSVRWLAGSDVVRVYAEADNFKCRDAAEQWPEFYDNAVVSLRFASGALGTIDGTCPAHYGYDARVEVLCEGGLLSIGHTAQAGYSEVRLDGQSRQPAVKSWRNLFKDAYLAEMEHFIDCIRTEQTPRIVGLDGLRAVEAVVASNQSLREQRPVELAHCLAGEGVR